MKALLQAGSSGRMPVPPEKRFPINSAPGRIQVLCDRVATAGQLFNRGDRALQHGLRAVLSQRESVEVVAAGWKTFPSLTLEKLRSACRGTDVAETLNQWADRLIEQSRRKPVFQTWVHDQLQKHFLIRNPLGRWIDQLPAKRTSLRLTEALAPRILKSYYPFRFISGIQDADLVVFNGSGLLADHLTHFLPGWMMEVIIAARLGKPVLAVNFSASIREPLARELLRSALTLTSMNFCRENYTAAYLADLGVPPERIRVTVDSAFAADMQTLSSPEALARTHKVSEKTAIVILRGDADFDFPAVEGLLRHLRDVHKLEPCFLFTAPSQDYWVYRRLRRQLRLSAASPDLDYPEIIALMKHARLVITNRYHAAIFSVMAGTPFIPVRPLTFKMNGFVDLLQYPIPVIDPPKAENASEYHAALKFLMNEEPSLRRHLDAEFSRLRSRAFREYQEVYAYLPGGKFD